MFIKCTNCKNELYLGDGQSKVTCEKCNTENYANSNKSSVKQSSGNNNLIINSGFINAGIMKAKVSINGELVAKLGSNKQFETNITCESVITLHCQFSTKEITCHPSAYNTINFRYNGFSIEYEKEYEKI